MKRLGRSRHARPRPPVGSTLAPLRWVAQEELVYDSRYQGLLHAAQNERFVFDAKPAKSLPGVSAGSSAPLYLRVGEAPASDGEALREPCPAPSCAPIT